MTSTKRTREPSSLDSDLHRDSKRNRWIQGKDFTTPAPHKGFVMNQVVPHRKILPTPENLEEVSKNLVLDLEAQQVISKEFDVEAQKLLYTPISSNPLDWLVKGEASSFPTTTTQTNK